MDDAPLLQSIVPALPLLARGKVRDIDDLDDALLITCADAGLLAGRLTQTNLVVHDGDRQALRLQPAGESV